MDLKELRKKNDLELDKLLKLKREQLRDLRFKVSSKQHKDVRDIRHTKTVIARILTIVREKEIVKKLQSKKQAK